MFLITVAFQLSKSSFREPLGATFTIARKKSVTVYMLSYIGYEKVASSNIVMFLSSKRWYLRICVIINGSMSSVEVSEEKPRWLMRGYRAFHRSLLLDKNGTLRTSRAMWYEPIDVPIYEADDTRAVHEGVTNHIRYTTPFCA